MTFHICIQLLTYNAFKRINSISESMTTSFTDDCQNHISWMQSILDGSGTPNESGNKSSNEIESQVDDLLASIESKSSKPDAATEDKTSTETEKKEHQCEKQYRISDPNDESSDCEEYYVNDAAEIRGQEIPQWARATNLIKELQKQQTIDPDSIFFGFETSCDLDEMFEMKKKSFKVRGDSGWWVGDAVTPEEVQRYKQALGLSGNT